MARRLATTSTTVTMFANKTYRPGLEVQLTRQLLEELASRGVLRGERADAELVLEGWVSGYTAVPLSYSAADRIREYRATLTVEALLRENKNSRTIWKGSRQASQDYPASSDPVLQQNNEAAAQEALCRQLARLLYQSITEDF